MITDALLDMGFAVVEFFWNLVPSWTLEFPNTQATASWLTQFNYWAPVSEMFWILDLIGGALIVFIALKVIIKVVDWIMDVIP